MTGPLVPSALPIRPVDGHKGTFGTVLVIGGRSGSAERMLGAPALTALGALRSGCGRVVLATPEPILDRTLTIVPSATGCVLPVDGDGDLDASAAMKLIDAIEPTVDAVVVGPGMGRGPAVRRLVARLLSKTGAPMVIDADALNAVADDPSILDGCARSCVLTPHPGEYTRLASSLGLPDVGEGEASRREAAASLARRVGGVVVLKGPGSVVTDGTREWICEAGSVVLAVPGSGDVQAGVIGSLLAQAVGEPPEALAALGTLLHATAGRGWERTHGSVGMLASDLADALPMAMREVGGSL